MSDLKHSKFKSWHFVVLFIASIILLIYLAIYSHSASKFNIVYNTSSKFSDIWVYDNDKERCLTFEKPGFNTITQSCMALENNKVSMLHYQTMILGALYLNPNPSKILMLGLGGGNLLQYIKNAAPNYNRFDIVEIDPEVYQVAKKFFNLKEDRKTKVIIQDGEKYILDAIRQKKYYDLIILDISLDKNASESLISPLILNKLKKILHPKKGVMAINTFSDSKSYKEDSDNVFKVFGKFYNLSNGNRVILLQNKDLPALDTIHKNADKLQNTFDDMNIDRKWLISKFVTYDKVS